MHRKPGVSFVHKVPYNAGNSGGGNVVRTLMGSYEDLCRVRLLIWASLCREVS